MPKLRALVKIARDTGREEDVVTNTLYFDVDNGTAAAAAAEVHAGLTTFYQAIDGLLAGDLIASTADVSYYDMAEDEPRVPVLEDDIALTPTAGSPLPAEVAICLSFHGAQVSGVNMRRRRGRIFVGPVTAATGTSSVGFFVPSGATRTTLANAGASLKAYTGTLGISWAVFSPTTLAETGSLDAAFEDVTGGWVDNEYDTQRRRGHTPSSRTTWS